MKFSNVWSKVACCGLLLWGCSGAASANSRGGFTADGQPAATPSPNGPAPTPRPRPRPGPREGGDTD